MIKGSIVLNVRELSVIFPGPPEFPAVCSLSFQIKSGETLALVGQSGSGKSVSSLAIMGLLPVTAKISGHIDLGGHKNINHLDNRALCRLRGKEMAMVFQEPMSALNPVKSIGYQLVESIRVHQDISYSEARKQAIDWMDKVKLPDPVRLFKRFPHQLSGGQKQRVMIAMAMCNHPKLLIADEPTTALDVTVQKEVIDLMLQLQKEFGIALLFITHDLNLARTIADDFLIMENGKVIHNMMSFAMPSRTEKEISLDKPALLEVRNLSVVYEGEKKLFQKQRPEFRAVSDVSFKIFPGETLGLVGESGCGKSTLSKALLGLQPVSGGRIFFQNKDLTRLSNREWRKLRRDIQIIFQDPFASLNPRIKVGDALKEPMWVHHIFAQKDLEKQMEDLLELVQMPRSAKDKYPHEFSGGQRQRICIARALALQPRLVICDESVSALDVKIQAQILKLLRELQEQKQLTYLFITHDLHVVRAVSDRILVMRKGSIVEQGDTESIMVRPRNEYTKRLLAAIPKPA
ncbi:MAG TPA: ABC transporter ATP-binding protein [Edaphocola sp.]|nr:ABC transporter ATP-binding protein [Edaphocola sp.]